MKSRWILLSFGAIALTVFVLLAGFWHLSFFPTATNPNQNKAPSASQEELVSYALSLINADRKSSNVQNVTLTSIDCAQKHAEDMLKNHYFSHWDTQGYKPYVRYTLAGGKGAVDENLASQSGTYLDVKQAIKDLEWSMVNDDADWNWSHRSNILDFFHNKVSIGIAYDDSNVFLVEDFEDEYVNWTTLKAQDGNVTMNGGIIFSGLAISEVEIFYDATTNLTGEQLSNQPFNGSYTPGTLVGAAVPSGWQSRQGITITATIWSQMGQDFQISFDLSPAFAQKGRGIYTLYLFVNTERALTTYSILF